MLAMRPNCETCDCDLSPQINNAFICSFECTFCEKCSSKTHQYVCPNCKGDLARRPTRSGQNLENYPASAERVQP